MTTSEEQYKRCAHKDCPCGDELQPMANFGVNNSAPSGRAYWCRKCASREAVAWKKNHPEKVAEWKKAYVARNKARNEARRKAAEDASRYQTTD